MRYPVSHFEWRVAAQLEGGDVEAIVVVSVRKVVNVKATNRIDTIVDGAFPGSFACPGEISFQSRSSSVKVAHDVSVVGPTLSEYFF